jgi:hypothetical protein
MEEYISLVGATLGIGLLLSVVALYLLITTAEKVRHAVWGFAIFSVVLNALGCYFVLDTSSYFYTHPSFWMLGSPSLGALIMVWFFGVFAVAFALYPLRAPYVVHGIHSPFSLVEDCTVLFWPLAALGAFTLYVAHRCYSPKSQENPAETASPVTWEEARKKKQPAGKGNDKAETVEATKEDSPGREIRMVEPIPRGARVTQFSDWRKRYPCPACGRKIRSGVCACNPDGTVEHLSSVRVAATSNTLWKLVNGSGRIWRGCLLKLCRGKTRIKNP